MENIFEVVDLDPNPLSHTGLSYYIEFTDGTTVQAHNAACFGNHTAILNAKSIHYFELAVPTNANHTPRNGPPPGWLAEVFMYELREHEVNIAIPAPRVTYISAYPKHRALHSRRAFMYLCRSFGSTGNANLRMEPSTKLENIIIGMSSMSQGIYDMPFNLYPNTTKTRIIAIANNIRGRWFPSDPATGRLHRHFNGVGDNDAFYGIQVPKQLVLKTQQDLDAIKELTRPKIAW